MSNFPNAIHVALLDDHAQFRQTMCLSLKALPYVDRISEAATFAELLAICQQHVPDVVLLDLQMPQIDGAAATTSLRREFPTLKIVILSMFDEHKLVAQLMRLGACGYVVKGAGFAQVQQAIEDVVQKGVYFTEHTSLALLEGIRKPTRRLETQLPNPLRLTNVQHQILKMVCEGGTAAQIAQKLFNSPRTVEGHIQTLFKKTGTHNVAGLRAFANQEGLLNPPS